MNTSRYRISVYGLAPCVALVLGAGGLLAGPGIVADGSKHFPAVREHLRPGGGSFGYIDLDEDAEEVGAFVDDAMKLILQVQGDAPPELAGLSVKGLVGDLGLDNIAAVGWSSHPQGDYVQARSYLHVPGGREGLLELVGGAARPFLAPAIAPAGTDLVLEQEFNVPALVQVVDRVVRRLGVDELQTGWGEFRSQPVPPLGMSVGQLLAKLDTRLALIVRLRPEDRIDAPDAPIDLPMADALLALDRAGWLVGRLRAEMPPEVAEGIEEGEGFLRLQLPPMPPEDPLARPVIHFDTEAGRLLLATSPEFLEVCLAGGGGLAGEASFKEVVAGLPEEGNAFGYVSERLSAELRRLLVASAEAQGEREAFEFGWQLVERAMPMLAGNYASASANLPDGILSVSNSKGEGSSFGTTSVTAVAIVGAITVPVFSSIQRKAKQNQELQMLRQCSLALRVWAADNGGKYPDRVDGPQLIELVGTEKIFRYPHPETGEVRRPLYVAGLTDSTAAKYVLLASPWVQAGKRAVVYCDGSAGFVDARQFERELAVTLEETGGKLAE